MSVIWGSISTTKEEIINFVAAQDALNDGYRIRKKIVIFFCKFIMSKILKIYFLDLLQFLKDKNMLIIGSYYLWPFPHKI